MYGLLIAFTRLLNELFGGLITSVVDKLGIHPVHPAAPIRPVHALEIFVALILLLFFVMVRLTLNVERPGKIQHLAEMIHEFVNGQAEAIFGHHGYEPHLPFVTTILLFVLLCNCLGLLPHIETPTSDPVVPLGIAILTFLYYNLHGVLKQGPVGYLKHFMGPMWWLAPLMFPIEIISHLARIMSLTVRLYANMFASDLLTLVFFSLVPIAIPIIFLGLHFGVALIQAYVFMLLAMIYLAEATAQEH
ncbi:F0F1 ATP synthase subunit A [Pseudacidobacterium ailaaui]|jgi:F-type H+-transporting ATPase subunit a|uniref:F0F1 ATP synthase subunit A n=1 Tax=Pseudacidobacterium ailaaui TaxID=1382359 RepID=UPI0005D17F64|nr:F0F1 ATP synthase subunit A [Pseudacidobacterium ailaaui]MBX6358538.1 F0F1 ATP synthase subunit A [Pseudacidobacterium ailaaui]MCL6464105.1 F0F1 ATP synthase subunit A [Pseudacidobacterium ailaaui]MDI3254188.1 F0F1 ATP synthase subunit A [Bacillota bacterium]